METDKGNGKNFVKRSIVSLLLLAACVLTVTGCVIGCNYYVHRELSNTRYDAVELIHGEKQKVDLHLFDTFWFYFDLETAANVAIDYSNTGTITAYLYAEEDRLPEPLPEESTEPDDGYEHGLIAPESGYESRRLADSGFESFDLTAGRYYVYVYVDEIVWSRYAYVDMLFMMTDRLPDLPTDTEHVVASAGKYAGLANDYYKLDLTEQRSDFTADAFMPENVLQRIYFYYGENSRLTGSLYFDAALCANGAYSQTYTLPAGRTIVKINTYFDGKYRRDQPDATVRFTVEKAAPGTVFEREVSALPEVPLGTKLHPSELCELAVDFTGKFKCGLYSMHIDLPADSVLSIRVVNYPASSTLNVAGYYNTDPLNGNKLPSGSAVFGAPSHGDDSSQSFELPAGFNLIEVWVNLDINCPAADFAAATIEFGIAPASEA